MQRGILKDNMIYCPKCGECNYQLTNDYRLVSIKGKKYTEFVVRCLTDNCGEKFYYQTIITMNSNERFSFEKNEEIEIIEE